MGRNIKAKEDKIKIKNITKSEIKECNIQQYPWYSFQYMTKNKTHSLKYLDSLECTEREKTLKNLFLKLEELSGSSWLYWLQQPKKTGAETIRYDEIDFLADSDANLTRDTPIYIFRFDTYRGNKCGRILGFKKSPCSVLYILGYDFDFSAYKHN